MKAYERKVIAMLVLILVVAFIIKNFFSPPEAIPAVSPIAGDSLIYYHSIEEMQEWCGADIDNEWGPETDRLYRAKWDRVYCDKMALETFNVE